MTDKYILNGRNVVPAEDLITWAKWMETADRQIAFTRLDDCEISTVFLGLNFSLLNPSQPLLFESMIFGGNNDGYLRLYLNIDDAELGHKQIVAGIKLGLLET